jgi:hypothetical protein
MAQVIDTKAQGFVQRYSGAVQDFINIVNRLADLKAEWDAQGYATGAPAIQATSFNITDAQVQAVLPAATASMLNNAVGAVEAIRTTVSQNTGYLYPMKP